MPCEDAASRVVFAETTVAVGHITLGAVPRRLDRLDDAALTEVAVWPSNRRCRDVPASAAPTGDHKWQRPRFNQFDTEGLADLFAPLLCVADDDVFEH